MTMKELARIADVSSAAVSRYLNGGSLSQEKRERIREAIEKTGYQPDAVAQMLRTGTTDHVGLIVPNISSDSVSRVTAGATRVLSEEGYLCLLANTDNDPEKELAYLGLFENRSVAGVILMATVLTPRHEEMLKNAPFPIVVAGQQFRQVPCVYHDDFGAAHDLTERVIAKGRRNIGYIGVIEQDVAAGLNRRRGVQAAMKDHGLDPSALVVVNSPFNVEGGRTAMAKLLEEMPQVDGVVCATDLIAFGAMEVLRQSGRRMPEDVSVTGIGDSWAGEYIAPHLTTAHFYYEQSGETAARLLLDIMAKKGAPGPIHQTMLGYTIVERDSI